MSVSTTQERFKRGAADAGRYFQFMAEFIGFTPADAEAIRDTRFIIEKHIPAIVAGFYAQLLRYPATRRHFQKKDGSLDQEYLEMRMHHQAGFWRRAASGVYDEDFARFVDYVGRAHTSQGADPKIYIPERYVMGMVGFVQRSVAAALAAELHEIDPDLELRALRGWNALLMVILEMLSRPYGRERDEETFEQRQAIDDEAVFQLAVETYERGLGIARSIAYKDVLVGKAADIPEGGRRIIQVEDLSIGVFRHQGQWYALHNSCLHRGGPVCAGDLQGEVLTCPWHGYQYNLTNGQLLLDSSVTLPMYEVAQRGEEVVVRIPILMRDAVDVSLEGMLQAAAVAATLQENEFRLQDLKPGQVRLLHLHGQSVAVYNVDGEFYATQDACTHADGPLSEGDLEGKLIICPWHDSCFDVTNGQVACGPATEPLQTFRVVVEGDVGRVEQG